MTASGANQRGKMVNSFDAANITTLSPAKQGAIRRRAKLLGPAYRLFYADPVDVVRGQGAILYDAEGNEYLDAYNNVVSVGHAHPRVVEALTRQAGTLCTHTRYIQDGILAYAEDLLSTHIEGLDHVMFTCTGSEANDLALRIAKHRTGKRGIIVTAEAYHGNSDLTAGFSPSLGIGSPLGEFVRQVPTPDSYRVSTDDLGRWLAEHVEAQILDLQRHGDGLAAFIADSLFSSDGIFSDPAVLAPVAQVVREAGGLFIADEVQSGFGRSGTHMWGYDRHHVQPDIVSMGKPMGNGYPVAGICVRHDVVSGFGRDTRYFNTFGGNSVAVAVAQATLDVVRDEKLMDNAERVGREIRAGLTELASRYEVIGDVRGAGLYIGVELVTSRATKEPDPYSTAAVVNGLRQRRVLISATGLNANTLKIRPPLIFESNHADRLLTQLEAALRDLER